MEITKSAWVTDGDSLRLQMPFAKVDTEKRLVSGFATLDNVDQQGDIVLADASHQAFSRFRGNIREMHNEKIAAGRMVSFNEDEFYDPTTNKSYKGVFVTAYVSKGAQDTWEKVLDGTLTGFSIGGKINDSENQWSKDASTNVRIVKDYDLIELSLVDNPANQLANVFSIQKNADGSATVKGMVAEVELKSVYWCPEDKVSKSTSDESATCSFCGNTMQNIGWFETGNDQTEKVREIVTKFLGAGDNATDTNEGGVESVTVENNETETGPTIAEVDEVAEAEQVEEVQEDGAVVDTEAEPVDEATETDTDLTKMFDELKGAVNDSLVKAETVTADAVAKVEEKITEVTQAFEKTASELTDKFIELEKGLDSIKTDSSAVAKRLEALEGETAIKKSADVADDSINKSAESESLFKGTFLSLNRL